MKSEQAGGDEPLPAVSFARAFRQSRGVRCFLGRAVGSGRSPVSFGKMNLRFSAYVAVLPERLDTLLACSPLAPSSLPRGFSGAGVYLFSEAGRHLYVGRSDDLRCRIQTHVRPSSKRGQAAFAYRLAREIAGITEVSYKKLRPEEDWSLLEPFRSAFPASKERIRKMELRVVSEADPVLQTLLEVYVAISLDTPYNDFDNH